MIVYVRTMTCTFKETIVVVNENILRIVGCASLLFHLNQIGDYFIMTASVKWRELSDVYTYVYIRVLTASFFQSRVSN